MKLYVAMIRDRHIDPEPYVFSTAEAAIDFARVTAQAWARGGDVDETYIPEGVLYLAIYSIEGDSVWVLEKTLDAPEEPT